MERYEHLIFHRLRDHTISQVLGTKLDYIYSQIHNIISQIIYTPPPQKMLGARYSAEISTCNMRCSKGITRQRIFAL